MFLHVGHCFDDVDLAVVRTVAYWFALARQPTRSSPLTELFFLENRVAIVHPNRIVTSGIAHDNIKYSNYLLEL